MPERRITLTFRHQQAQTYRVDLRTAEGRDYTGTFTLSYDAPTWAAIMQALEPGFDPAQAPDEVREALAPLGDLNALRVTVGDALGQALFTDDALIEGLLGPLSSAASERNPLPVTLRFGNATDLLAALPWELLRHRDRFLVADGSLGLTRCPTSVEPPTPAHADLPLRVLLVLAEPLDAPPIFAHGARQELRHGLRTLDQEGAVIVDALEPPTFDTLVEAVTNGDYHLVVFYGHGAYDPDEGGLLLFEDRFGGQDAVPAAKVGAVLHNTSVRMALLSACQSGQVGAERGVWSGTAPALLRAGLPLVVGMQTRLRIDAAQAFIRQFALSLAQAKPIAAAVGEARKPLLHGSGEQWFVPVLYGRPADSDRLFDPDAALPPETADLRARLRELRAKIADLEQIVEREKTAYRPEELAALRAARRDFAKTRAKLARKTPGGYTQVVSPLYGVPENRIFVGRSAEMRAVGQRLATGDPVVIWGTGGIGKTALAAEVARRQRWHFPGGVLWLDCSGSPALDTLLNRLGAFAGLAVEQIEPDRKPTAVRHALALLDDRYLVVFDNAEDVWDDRAVRQLIDRLPDNGQVLLTTRHHPRKSMWRMMEVKRMADSFMTMLFYRQAEADSLQIRGKRNMEAIPKIIKWMQGHPKALELTEKLLTSFPAAKIWADLQRHPVKGFSAVFATSIKHLTELQRTLFTRLSVFAIPFEWDAAYTVLPDTEEGTVDDALDVLVQRALVAFDGARYAYHALVRQYAHERLQESGADPRVVHRRAAEYLGEKLADEKRGGTPEEALEEVDQWKRAEAWATFARRAHAMRRSLDRRGYWGEIEARLEQALAAVRAHLDKPELEATLLSDLGIIARKRGAWNWAIKIHHQSLGISERMGDVHGQAQTLNNLGSVYMQKGQWDRAIEIYQKSLDLCKRVGDMHALAQTWGNLGLVYADKGEWDQAIAMYRKSMENLEGLHDMHDIAQVWGNWGNVCLQKGEWDRAITMYQRSLQTFRWMGDLHGQAQTFGNLGNVYLRRGQWDRAITMYQRSLDIFERMSDIEGQALTLSNLGELHLGKGELDQALYMYQQSLKINKRLGNMHGIAQTRMGLGVIYRHKGLLDQAIEMLQQSLEISRNMGNMHDIALALGNLGSVIRQKGEWNQAIELYEESLTITERMGDWVNSANQYGNLGNLYLQTNRPDEAKPLLARAYLIFSQLGSPHQRTSANALIQSFDGDVDAANAYLAEAQRELQEEMTSDDE